MSAALQSDPAFPGPPMATVPDGRDPDLGSVLSYWSDKRGGRRMPSRADIDPIDIPSLLPHIGLVDVEDRPRRYRYRLVGSFIAAMWGESFQGRYLDTARHKPYRTFLHDLYCAAVDSRGPMLSEAIFDYGGHAPVTIRRMILPLAPADDAPVNMLLFANQFSAPDLPDRSTPMSDLHMEPALPEAGLDHFEEILRQPLPLD